MKILAINASHRGDQGYTRFLIDRLFQGASAAGAECDLQDVDEELRGHGYPRA